MSPHDEAVTNTIAQIVGLAIYNIFFHPLAKYPGPLIAKLTRCIDGKNGRALLRAQAETRARLAAGREHEIPSETRATAAVAEACRRGLITDRGGVL